MSITIESAQKQYDQIMKALQKDDAHINSELIEDTKILHTQIRAVGKSLADPIERERYTALVRGLGERLNALTGEFFPLRLEPLQRSSVSPWFEDSERATTDQYPSIKSTIPVKPYANSEFLYSLREPSGTESLESIFYIEREGDHILARELSKSFGTTTVICAPRQTGKSSLLIRGGALADRQGSRLVLLDIQTIDVSDLRNLDTFLRYLAMSFIKRIPNLESETTNIEQLWNRLLGPAVKITSWMEDRVLPLIEKKLVLAIDEADRLLSTDFHRDVFGMLRSWHNYRAGVKLWEKLDMILVISTEPHLIMDDVNQSPFNVGLRIDLEDFTENQVRELNSRYQSPVFEQDIPDVIDLLDGHPYLTRKALYTLVTKGWNWSRLRQVAKNTDGPFGDHLRRYVLQLRRRPELRHALKEIIDNESCSDESSYYHLFRAGLVKGVNSFACRCRCKLYAEYLRDKI